MPDTELPARHARVEIIEITREHTAGGIPQAELLNSYPNSPILTGELNDTICRKGFEDLNLLGVVKNADGTPVQGYLVFGKGGDGITDSASSFNRTFSRNGPPVINISKTTTLTFKDFGPDPSLNYPGSQYLPNLVSAKLVDDGSPAPIELQETVSEASNPNNKHSRAWGTGPHDPEDPSKTSRDIGEASLSNLRILGKSPASSN